MLFVGSHKYGDCSGIAAGIDRICDVDLTDSEQAEVEAVFFDKLAPPADGVGAGRQPRAAGEQRRKWPSHGSRRPFVSL